MCLVSQELVAELDIVTYETKKALREGYGDQVFPDPSRGHKYYMEQIAVQDIAGRSTTPIAATMQLEWTGALKLPSRIREVFHVLLRSIKFTYLLTYDRD